jgi:hypothetical protein
MANARRGEVCLQLGEDRYTLCFTLGALAELEDAFGVTDLMALAERFSTGRLSARDILSLLACALRGGGHDMSDDDVARLPLGDALGSIADAIAKLLVTTFGASSANPPQPQA